MCGSFKSGGKCAVKHFYETFFVVQSNIFTNFPSLTVGCAYVKIYSELGSLTMCYLTRCSKI